MTGKRRAILLALAVGFTVLVAALLMRPPDEADAIMRLHPQVSHVGIYDYYIPEEQQYGDVHHATTYEVAESLENVLRLLPKLTCQRVPHGDGFGYRLAFPSGRYGFLSEPEAGKSKLTTFDVNYDQPWYSRAWRSIRVRFHL